MSKIEQGFFANVYTRRRLLGMAGKVGLIYGLAFTTLATLDQRDVDTRTQAVAREAKKAFPSPSDEKINAALQTSAQANKVADDLAEDYNLTPKTLGENVDQNALEQANQVLRDNRDTLKKRQELTETLYAQSDVPGRTERNFNGSALGFIIGMAGGTANLAVEFLNRGGQSLFPPLSSGGVIGGLLVSVAATRDIIAGFSGGLFGGTLAEMIRRRFFS